MQQTLAGKKFVVTGATSGIGYATAAELVRQGAWVIGVGRSAARCREAENRLRALNPQGRATFLVADLALQSQVRALAQAVQQLLAAEGQPGLDGLVNNAATFTYWFSLTPEGFETQWAVNHLAPFLLTHLLLPNLAAAPAARVVTVSSNSHYAGHLDSQPAGCAAATTACAPMKTPNWPTCSSPREVPAAARPVCAPLPRTPAW